ncbi:MAG: DUF58 domain-containing protein [Chloroflexi bacterium]|nr:MAG: DUF58 domain-containing protein [Chloroflexota bacterium]
MLFDEKTLRKLTRLTLVAKKIRAGAIKGERRSTKRGSSVEFADYRNYAPGDDLRRLDWNVYARHERPFIKLMEEEEDLAVHVLVDGSQSMDWGEGDANKFRYAQRLAAALGAITLAAGDRLHASILYAGGDLNSRERTVSYGPARGQPSLSRYLSFLESAKARGTTDLNRSLRDYSLSFHRPGLAFLISDLFAAGGYQPGISQLQSRGHEVVLVHLLSPDEVDPQLAGDLRLVDVETGQTQEVSLDGGLRDLYRRRVQSWQAEIQGYSRKYNIRYLPVTTEEPWDKVVLYEMRRAVIVK